MTDAIEADEGITTEASNWVFDGMTACMRAAAMKARMAFVS